MFAAVAVMVRLGVWQLDRMETRRAFNTHVVAMQASPLLVLDGSAISTDLTSMEYRHALATGAYDFEHQIALRNQYLGDPDGPAEYGYHLLTPLVMADGKSILVDRGWIPGEYDTPESWRRFDEAGTIIVIGILRLPLEEGEMGGGVPDPDPVPGQVLYLWNFIHLDRLAGQIPNPLLPVYLQRAPGEGQARLPESILPVLELNDGPHLGYALQWFLYAFLVFFGYPIYLHRQAGNELLPG